MYTQRYTNQIQLSMAEVSISKKPRSLRFSWQRFPGLDGFGARVAIGLCITRGHPQFAGRTAHDLELFAQEGALAEPW